MLNVGTCPRSRDGPDVVLVDAFRAGVKEGCVDAIEWDRERSCFIDGARRVAGIVATYAIISTVYAFLVERTTS